MTTPQLLDKREARIRRMFGQIAPCYDFLNHLLSLNIDRRWRRTTARLVPAGPPELGPVLDLCTGTGDLALTYDAATGGTVPVVGADFCHEMLVRAAEKAGKAGAGGRVRFVEADAQALPFADDTFQIVAVAFGLRNVTDTSRGHHVSGSWYFRYALPLVGQLLSRSRENAYRYLPASVLRFPDYEALAEKLRGHGLVDVRYEPLTFGVATLYVGVKPARL